MLQKGWRLVKDKEIKKAYSTRLRARTDFTNLYLSKTLKPNFQLLVVVSKKIYKKANKRNRIKRKIESVFEKLKFEGRLPAGIACIVQVRDKQILLQSPIQINKSIMPSISKLYNKAQSKK
ncbi:MAG: ribonuclease P protein component [Patescibacteria group bacterium]